MPSVGSLTASLLVSLHANTYAQTFLQPSSVVPIAFSVVAEDILFLFFPYKKKIGVLCAFDFPAPGNVQTLPRCFLDFSCYMLTATLGGKTSCFKQELNPFLPPFSLIKWTWPLWIKSRDFNHTLNVKKKSNKCMGPDLFWTNCYCFKQSFGVSSNYSEIFCPKRSWLLVSFRLYMCCHFKKWTYVTQIIWLWTLLSYHYQMQFLRYSLHSADCDV